MSRLNPFFKYVWIFDIICRKEGQNLNFVVHTVNSSFYEYANYEFLLKMEDIFWFALSSESKRAHPEFFQEN